MPIGPVSRGSIFIYMPKKLLDLPVLKATVSEDPDSGVELTAVALVDKPAIMADFMAFSAETPIKFKADEARRIVTGPLMIADLPIYRKIKGKEFYLVFEAAEVYKMVQKFFKKGYQSNVNYEHNGELVEGVTLFESFIVDPERGVNALEAFKDVPAGSWFGSFYVENPDTWAKITDGTFSGFSIEGLFTLTGLDEIPAELQEPDEELLKKLMNILKQKAKD